jgi:pimeloyl-ACP methyl ester carboxylesterase
MKLNDGRDLVVHDAGVGDALTVIWHHGSPATGALLQPLVRAAGERGIRLVSFGRASYGGSTPLPGRSIASVVADVAQLGIERFAVMGYSGGGPHALACAALLPERVVGAATFGCPAPLTDEFDWFDGMADEGSLRAAVAGTRAEYDGDFVEESFIDRDYAALRGTWSALNRDVQAALEAGGDGIIADDNALVAPWGFSLADIAAPTLLLHGALDRVVPVSHGRYLDRQIIGSTLAVTPDDGHVSILDHSVRAFDWLLENAR